MKQKYVRSAYMTAIVMILFVTGITFSKAFFKQGVLIPKVLGEEVEQDDSDEGEEIDGEDEDENDDEDKEDDEDENDDEEKTEVRRTETRVQRKPIVPTATTVKTNDEEGDDEDEIQEDLADVNKEIAKAEALLASTADQALTAQAKVLIDEARNLVVQAQTFMITNQETAKAYLESAENKAEKAKELLEPEDDDDDEDEADEADEDVDENETHAVKTYKNAVAQFVHDIKTIESDEKIGPQVRVVAQQQNNTVTQTKDAIKKVESRGKFVRFLIGADTKSIASIESTIAQNTSNIAVLQGLLASATDEKVKAVLQKQISTLEQQNAALSTLVQEKDTFSLFGWLVRMFD